MNTITRGVFGPRFMLAILMAAFANLGLAQDTDEFEPAVDTSAYEPAVDASAYEPAVDTSAAPVETADESESEEASELLAADVTRDESGSQVMDTLELGRTEITGNQELPKVLYIVPWQKPEPGDLTGKPVNSLIDDVLAPIDRDEFVRQVDYFNDLNGD